MSERVFVASRRRHRRVFHTDRECQYIKQASHRIQERGRDELGEQWSACKHCTGTEQTGQTERSWGHYRALRAAAEGGDA